MWIAFLTLAVVTIVMMVVGALVPIRLHISMHGQGEPSGLWILAGGARVGPFTVAASGALGVPFTVVVRVFKWQIYKRELKLVSLLERKVNEDETDEPPGPSVTERYQQLKRWIEPDELAAFLAGEHKRVQIEHVEVELKYSFADVALTGAMFGGVAVVSGMLPPTVQLRQEVIWEPVDKAAASVGGRIRVWPGRFVLDTLSFAWRNLKLRRVSPPASESDSADSESADQDREDDNSHGNG